MSTLTVNKRNLISFVSAFALSAIGMSATDAQAVVTKYTRTHANACATYGGAPIDVDYAVHNDSTASRMVVLCDVSDDDRFPKSLVKRVNFHGNDGNNDTGTNGQVLLATCRTDANATSGSCSASAASSATGTGAFALTRTGADIVFGIATDFVYTYVNLPVKDGASRSSARGMWTADDL